MTAPKAPASPPSLPSLPPPPTRGQSFAFIAWRRFLRNRLAVGAFAVVILFASIAVWCPLLATDKPFYIRAIFHESYDNSYYSALDLISRLERADAQAPSPDSASKASPDSAGQDSPERGEQENAATIRLLENRLRDLEESLAPAARPAIASLRETAAKNLTGASREKAAALRAELEKAAHPDRAPLIAQRRFPAFLAIRAIEMFFIILWTLAWATALIAPLRRAGFRRLAMILFLPSLIGAISWRIGNPPTHDLTTYRSIIEQPRAPVVFLRAPVPYGENENITSEANQPPPWFLPPAVRAASRHTHWLGTDPNGRDVLARMIWGARISMLIGIVAVSIYVTIGIIAGAAAGYFRGWTDMILSRIIEIVICFPDALSPINIIGLFAPEHLYNHGCPGSNKLDGDRAPRARGVFAARKRGFRSGRPRPRRRAFANHLPPHPPQRPRPRSRLGLLWNRGGHPG